MNKKAVVSIVAVGALACGHLLAAADETELTSTSPTVVAVFDPFQLTTVTVTEVEPVVVVYNHKPDHPIPPGLNKPHKTRKNPPKGPRP